MSKQSTRAALRQAIDQLSVPFARTEEVKVVSMKLDALAGHLLKSPYVKRKIGPSRMKALTKTGPALTDLSRMIGGDSFVRAAESAADLLSVGTSSIVDFGGAGDELVDANDARERLRDALADVLKIDDL